MASMSETPSNQPQASADLVSSDGASPTSHQATHAVFSTNELLCDIIVRLPSLKDILVTTGVCKTWRKALKDNVAIQQALFLAPIEITDINSEVDCLSMSFEEIDKYSIIGKRHSHGHSGGPESPTTTSKICVAICVWSSCSGIHSVFGERCSSPSRPVLLSPSSYICPYRQKYREERIKFTCETGVKMGELHDFCGSLFQSHPKAFGTNVTPDDFEESQREHSRGGRWDVRNGKVIRQTSPRLVELSDDSSEEYDDSDDKRDPYYYGDSDEEF